MKRFALYIGLATALMASCSIQEEDVKTPPQDDVIFYASFEQPVEAGTRVYANEDLLLRWTADDRVSIFNKLTYNQEYRFTGQTGANAGGFKKVDNDEFVTGNTISHVVSVYPYQESTAISESEETSLTLPAVQHYAENTFGLGANTMISVSDDNVLMYKNVGGYLRISLYGEGVSVSSITLKGNNGEKLAGKATVTMPLDGTPSAMMAEDATDQITLVCDTPVVLGATAEESTRFWFVVPPVTFSKGFTITVKASSGRNFEKSTDKTIAIVRNNLSKMAPIEVVLLQVPEAVDMGLPSGLKWASWNLGASKPEEYGDYYAWGETESYYSSLDPLVWKEDKDSGYNVASYKWCLGSYETLTKYCTYLSYGSYGYNGFIDNKTVLDLEDDAAHVNLGGSWRMPTDAEWTELRENCTWTWTTQNGVSGRLVTASNGNSIFLPAAGSWRDTDLVARDSGVYWSSSLDSDRPSNASRVIFYYGNVIRGYDIRHLGYSIRPVFGDFIFVESISLNESSLSIKAGEWSQLTATVSPSTATEKTVSWSSSNTDVATVDFKGIVSGVSAGTATITAWSSDGQKSATCNVTVSPGDYYNLFDIPSVEEDGRPRAFPGAEGGGMYATGGRGGYIYHVTSLEDNGTIGTLRYGIENAQRPLTIVFDVAGTIELHKQLQIKKGDLTIAGQSAPGDGICLKNYTFRISASNVIVRFIRCRMGDEMQTEDDAIQVMSHEDDKYEKIIIDHCSVSWSTDECASFYGMKDFTFQWNIVSESLRNSIHDKGAHGYGGIWGGNNATYHHNLLVHHDSRNPRLDHDYVSTQKGPVSIFNNVIYNWKGNTCYGGESSTINGTDYRKYNFFNNYYKPGPVTPSNHIWFLQPTTSCNVCGGTILPGHFYMDGNVMHGYDALTADNWMAGRRSPVSVYIIEDGAGEIKETSRFSTETSQSVHSSLACLDPVLTYAGASFARDNIDARIARETKNGTYTFQGSNTSASDPSTKGLIDTQTDVDDGTWRGGWPVYVATDEQMAKVKDSDQDGMPDWFEEQFGLKKTDKSDAGLVTLDKNHRYTNLEMYLHYLVKDIVTEQNRGSDYLGRL